MKETRTGSSRAAVLVLAACVPCAPARAEGAGRLLRARRLKETAIGHLKKAQLPGADRAGESRKAARALESAISLLEKYDEPRPPEVERELEDINSLVYWIRKMTPVDVPGLGRMVQTRRPAGKKRTELARECFQKAGDYARRNPGDLFLIAIKYFEVADRFQGTEWSLKAQGLSLEYQRKMLAGEPPSAAPPGDAAPRKPAVDRTGLVEELAEVLKEEELSPKDKLEIADKFLAGLPGDPLEGEVVSIRKMLAASDPDERSRAVARHFRLHADGAFTSALAYLRQTGDEAGTFAELVRILRSNASAPKKARVCREFLAQFPAGERKDEVARLQEAFSAAGGDQRIAAWASYRISFPDGAFAEEALSVLRRSETVLLALVKRALSKGEERRTIELGRLYLDVFPRGPAAAEMGSLLAGVMKTSPGPERNKAVGRHLRTYPGSALAGALRTVAEEWRKAAEKTAFEELVRELAAARSDAERLGSCERFLAGHPRGERAKEVRALRAAYALGSVKARLAAARRFLSEYSGSPLAESMKTLEEGLVGAVEGEAYRAAKAACSDDSTGYATRLAACESYISEFPDGEHVEEIRACEERMRSLIEEEEREFEKFEEAVSGVASPAEGVELCDGFVKKYPGGSRRSAVTERRRGFEKLLAEAAEAEAYRKLKAELAGGSASAVEKADACLRFMREHAGRRYRADVVKMLRAFASAPLASPAAPARAAAFSAASRHLVTVGRRRRGSHAPLYTWRLPGLELAATYRIGPGVTARSAAFSPAEGRLLLGENSGGLTVLDVLGGKVLGRYRLGPGPIVAVSAAPGGLAVTASLGDSKLRLWQEADWSSQTTFPCPGGVSAGAADESGRTVAVGSRDGTLAVFASGRAEPEWSEPEAHKGPVDCVAFSPDGRWLASASGADATVRLWGASSGEERWRAEDESSCAAFIGSDYVVTGALVASAGDGRVLARLGGTGPVAASPDGRFVFAAAEKGPGTIWYVPALLEE